jgi:hypothetical protein
MCVCVGVLCVCVLCVCVCVCVDNLVPEAYERNAVIFLVIILSVLCTDRMIFLNGVKMASRESWSVCSHLCPCLYTDLFTRNAC